MGTNPGHTAPNLTIQSPDVADTDMALVRTKNKRRSKTRQPRHTQEIMLNRSYNCSDFIPYQLGSIMIVMFNDSGEADF